MEYPLDFTKIKETEEIAKIIWLYKYNIDNAITHPKIHEKDNYKFYRGRFNIVHWYSTSFQHNSHNFLIYNNRSYENSRSSFIIRSLIIRRWKNWRRNKKKALYALCKINWTLSRSLLCKIQSKWWLFSLCRIR